MPKRVARAVVRRDAVARYALAAAFIAVAAGMNWVIWELIKPQVSPLFFAAVMISAWYGGLGPALFATALASFTSIYVFSDPVFSYAPNVADTLRVSVFFAVAVLVSALSAARRRAEHQLRAAHDDLERRVVERTRELAAANDALRDLAAEVVLAEQRERRRIAQHLHDEIGQVLALSQIRVGGLRASDDREQRHALCDTVEALVEEAIARTRSITCELSPPVLYELGLGAAVQWLADQCRRQSGVVVDVEREGDTSALPEDVSVTLFHVVRELLANTAKHARARQARVSLTCGEGEVTAVVQDDGIGFDAAAVAARPASDSFGMFSIRERVRHHRGTMQVETRPGSGSRVAVRLPLRPPHVRQEGPAAGTACRRDLTEVAARDAGAN